MRRIFTVMVMLVIALVMSGFAGWEQEDGQSMFPFQLKRAAEIPVPESDLNNGGVGNMISGVDLDGDGKTEIYLVNDNWNDTPSELVPRIYKLEKTGNDWAVVWKAVAPVEKQNTWPALTVADLDKDGKKEIIWGVVTNLSGVTNLNPPRILVYEVKGDGSDVLGVPDGSGNYLPNSKWSIATADNVDLRITRFHVSDPDNDGTPELIFSERRGTSSKYFFGVASVNKIPDNGDGSETWTLEVSGKDFQLSPNLTNKWDLAVIDNQLFFFDEKEISKVWWDGSKWNYKPLRPLAGGAPFVSAQVVDLDKDGTKEIIVGEYFWGPAGVQRGIALLQQDADTLVYTDLFRIAGAQRLFGSACGDIDQDGYLDFLFGTRAGVPDAALHRLSYKGGPIFDQSSYEFSTVDSTYFAGGFTNVINISNIDDDPYLEVLYTSSVPAGTFPVATQPILVLDYMATGVDHRPRETGPITFQLSQNYPNPFNPTTTIDYTLQSMEQVSLKIYNLLGEEIKTLVDGYISPGTHSVRWDATDNDGRRVSSGIYVYVLKIGNQQISKTLILAK